MLFKAISSKYTYRNAYQENGNVSVLTSLRNLFIVFVDKYCVN